MYKPCHADWRYTRIQIPDLNNIVDELTSVFWKIYDQKAPVSFISFDHNSQHWPKLPSLHAWLNRNNMHRDRWASCYFSITHGGLSPVHVDYTDESKFLAINIPLIDCDDSYTVWYDIKDQETVPIQSVEIGNDLSKLDIPDNLVRNTQKLYSSSFWCNETHTVEIDRAESTGPMLINISIPHRPVVNHNRLRVQFSLRLHPCSFEHDVKPYL